MSAERNGNDIDLLSAYLDGQLTDAERSALEARLEQDAELRRELAQLRATVELIRSLPEMSAPRDFRLNHIMVYGQRRQRRTSLIFSFASAAAAVVLLVSGVLLTLMSQTTTADLASSVTQTQSEAIALLATEAENASPVPTAALADTLPSEEDAAAARTGETGADGQIQMESPPMFAAPTGTQFDFAQSTPAPSDSSSAADSTMMELFSAAEDMDNLATSEVEILNNAIPPEIAQMERAEEAAAADEEAPVAGMMAAQPTQAPTSVAQATMPPPTPTAAATRTRTTTPTPEPTVTPLPTLPPSTPMPAPSPVQPSEVGAIGTILILVAVVLLTVSIFAYLLSRRR